MNSCIELQFQYNIYNIQYGLVLTIVKAWFINISISVILWSKTGCHCYFMILDISRWVVYIVWSKVQYVIIILIVPYWWCFIGFGVYSEGIELGIHCQLCQLSNLWRLSRGILFFFSLWKFDADKAYRTRQES